jgi:hypothetical protein
LLLVDIFAPKPRSRRRRPPPFPGNPHELPASAGHGRLDPKDLWLKDGMDDGTARLPEAFLAHLMLLWENRLHE